MCNCKVSYATEADEDSDRHQYKVPHEESNDPDHSQSPGDELVPPIRSGQQIPILDLLRLEPGRHVVLDDRLHARIHVVQAVLQPKVKVLRRHVLPRDLVGGGRPVVLRHVRRQLNRVLRDHTGQGALERIRRGELICRAIRYVSILGPGPIRHGPVRCSVVGRRHHILLLWRVAAVQNRVLLVLIVRVVSTGTLNVHTAILGVGRER